ncbi:putative ATP-dependent zinc protease [Vibrio paucivorans]
MFTKLVPFVALGLLSGCVANNGEQYHQETLAAIQHSESQLTNKITNIELNLSNQSDYIESLESEILALNSQVEKLQSVSHTSDKPQAEPQVAAAPVTAPKSSQTIVLGEIERVTIDSIKQTFDARVDTGAATSSLNAVDIQEFERNGNNWVRFHLSDGKTPMTDDNWIEAPIIRFAKIRQSTTTESERRAVIELWVKVGKIHEKAQFTLADRSQMSHPVLLGREFIRDIALVDVSRQYIHTDIKQK